ncbi:MAG: hypothetical protein FJX77_03155 [Armatimonadetes bacterium]|nr:hypothetical protein [Armatimonadota bacterium]
MPLLPACEICGAGLSLRRAVACWRRGDWRETVHTSEGPQEDVGWLCGRCRARSSRLRRRAREAVPGPAPEPLSRVSRSGDESLIAGPPVARREPDPPEPAAAGEPVAEGNGYRVRPRRRWGRRPADNRLPSPETVEGAPDDSGREHPDADSVHVLEEPGAPWESEECDAETDGGPRRRRSHRRGPHHWLEHWEPGHRRLLVFGAALVSAALLFGIPPRLPGPGPLTAFSISLPLYCFALTWCLVRLPRDEKSTLCVMGGMFGGALVAAVLLHWLPPPQ